VIIQSLDIVRERVDEEHFKYPEGLIAALVALMLQFETELFNPDTREVSSLFWQLYLAVSTNFV
jgi:hypothetical protein